MNSGIIKATRQRITDGPPHQEVVLLMPSKFTTPERFFHYVEFTTTCWLWIGGCNLKGYGVFHYTGGSLAHRWIYEFCVGPIPEGFTIDHLCRIHNCVLPDHMEPVTGRVNTLRGVGASAKAARATHCPQGHPYSGSNVLVRQTGHRVCRTCNRARNREYGRRKRLARAG